MFQTRSDYYLPLLAFLDTLSPDLTEREIKDLFERRWRDSIAPEQYHLTRNLRPRWETHLNWAFNELRSIAFLEVREKGTRVITVEGQAFLQAHAARHDRGQSELIARINAERRRHNSRSRS